MYRVLWGSKMPDEHLFVEERSVEVAVDADLELSSPGVVVACGLVP
jgi:hypothetical protein